MPDKEDQLWLDLSKAGSGLCLTLALVSGTYAIKTYTYDPACHGGWGACWEVHHYESGSTATAQITR